MRYRIKAKVEFTYDVDIDVTDMDYRDLTNEAKLIALDLAEAMAEEYEFTLVAYGVETVYAIS